jgi:hypothetical protein
MCFGSADKNIGLCICKTNDLSAGDGESYSFLARIGELKVRGIAILQGTAKGRTQVRDGAQLQMQTNTSIPPKDNMWRGPITLSTGALHDGQNSMLIKQGKGTLQFTKNGDKFSNVIYKDSTGAIIRLIPVPAGTQGAPRPDCKYPLPDACFGTADKSIGLCICKPNNISNGKGPYTFALNDGRSYVQGNF